MENSSYRQRDPISENARTKDARTCVGSIPGDTSKRIHSGCLSGQLLQLPQIISKCSIILKCYRYKPNKNFLFYALFLKIFFQVENGNFLKVIFLFWAKNGHFPRGFLPRGRFTKIYKIYSKIAQILKSFKVSAIILSNKQLLFEMFLIQI